MIMFNNLYPLSNTGYMNLGRALFQHDLIIDEEIDVCSHIFHILAKTGERTTSRNYLPFCRLISKILKLKGVHPLEDEHPYPQPSPINIRTLHASTSHTKKSTSKKAILLQEVQALPPMLMMNSQTISWLLSERLIPKCLDQLPSCTPNTFALTQSSHPSRLGWTKFKGSQKNMETSYSMTKRGRWCR